MKILKNIFLVLIVVIISITVSVFFGDIYQKVFNTPDTWTDVRGIAGLPLAYIFLLCFLMTIFGDSGKYWWIGVSLIPALFLEIFFDYQHVYFPIILGILGWALGWGARKIIAQFRPNFGN